MADVIFSTDRARIDKLEEEINNLEKKRRLLLRKIEEIKAGQSPIQPGDMIEWNSGSRVSEGG